MNPMHLHILLGHAPVVGLALGFLLIEAGVWKDLKACSRAGLWLIVGSWAAGVLVYVTGRAGEGLSVNLGAPAALVHAHEVWGTGSTLAITATALGAAAALRRRAGRRLLAFVSAASLLCIALLVRTSWHGGRIRHPELQPDWKEHRP